jgi:exosortase E/protease (VPEID-CTERM system)
MSFNPADIATVDRRSNELPLARWLGLIALLAAEVVLLTLLFEPYAFAQDGSWSSIILRNLQYIPRMAVVVAVTVLVFGRRWLQSESARLSSEPGRPHRAWLFLACHLIAFIGVTALSAVIFGKSAGSSALQGQLLPLWGLACLATFVFWANSLLPLSVWLRMVRRGSGVLVGLGVVGVAACQVGPVMQSFWRPLCRSTFWVVDHLLRIGFDEVISYPASFEIGTSTFMVNIGPGCSGFEGIGLIWILLLGSFWIFRERFRFPAALLLLPIGTVLIWLSNAVRIATLVAIGTLVSPELAVEGFHSNSGWLLFNLIGLGLLTAALRCPFYMVPAATNEGTAIRSSSPTAAYLMPLVAIVATAMVTGAVTEGFDRLYPLRVVTAATVCWWYKDAYAELRPMWSWEALGIGTLVFALWMALEPTPSGSATGSSPWTELSPIAATVWLIARVLGSVVFVPLAEELAFRGYLLRRMVAADFRTVSPACFTWVSVAVSSAAFGALHGRWLAGTLAGLVYALVFYRRGRLGDAVLAHATTNALIAVSVLATGNWSLWS